MAVPLSPSLKKTSLRLLAVLSSKVPLPILAIFAWLLSWPLSVVLKRDKEIAITQINFALPGTPAFHVYRRSIFGSILTVFEIFRTRQLLRIQDGQKLTGPPISQLGSMRIVGLNEFKVPTTQHEENLPQSVGGVCLSAHCGNFDIMAACFSFQNFPMSVIARKANDPVFHEFLSNLRKGYGIQMLWRESASGSRNLITAIRNKHFLCALIDQDVALENGFTPFFALQAAHPLAPIQIAVRFKKPVYACFTRRIKMGSHECHISRIHWEEVTNEPEQFIMGEYSRLLEKFITIYPDQWVWWHRRWRRREGVDYEENPEKLPSTREYLNWLQGLTRINESDYF